MAASSHRSWIIGGLLLVIIVVGVRFISTEQPVVTRWQETAAESVASSGQNHEKSTSKPPNSNQVSASYETTPIVMLPLIRSEPSAKLYNLSWRKHWSYFRQKMPLLEELDVERIPKRRWRRTPKGRVIFHSGCGSDRHGIKQTILHQYNYKQVNQWVKGSTADTNKTLEEWDFLFAVECSDHWFHSSGLKSRIDLSKLNQDQVMYPCFGGKDSYNNKLRLCEIQASLKPGSCLIWPRDRSMVEKRKDIKWWVVKLDRNSTFIDGEQTKYEQFSRGNSQDVHFKQTASEIDAIPVFDGGAKIVFPIISNPFLGPGLFKRRAEIKVYIAMIRESNNRPRYYMSKYGGVILARAEYSPQASFDDDCIQDTHVQNLKLDKGNVSCDERDEYHLNNRDRNWSLQAYCIGTGLDCDLLRQRIINYLASVFYHPISLRAFALNPAMRRMAPTNASCASWFRCDMGLTDDHELVLYECQRNPAADGINAKETHYDLFNMLEIHKSSRLPPHRRKEWEVRHGGFYQPFPDVNEDLWQAAYRQ